MKTILAPVDLSDAAEVVAKEAGELSKILGGRVLLLHVIMPAVMNEYAPEAERISDEGRCVVADLLEKMAGRLSESGVNVQSYLLNGPPVATIADEAVQKKADYIVMGSHGHGAFYNLLIGGTASGVIQHSQCPVMIVPIHRTATHHSLLASSQQ